MQTAKSECGTFESSRIYLPFSSKRQLFVFFHVKVPFSEMRRWTLWKSFFEIELRSRPDEDGFHGVSMLWNTIRKTARPSGPEVRWNFDLPRILCTRVNLGLIAYIQRGENCLPNDNLSRSESFSCLDIGKWSGKCSSQMTAISIGELSRSLYLTKCWVDLEKLPWKMNKFSSRYRRNFSISSNQDSS